MFRISSALCTLLLIVAFTPSTTHADPIFITSGTLTVTGLNGGPVYSLSGVNFASGGSSGEKGAVSLQNQCAPCSVGQVISVNATFAGSGLGANHAGVFTFTGPPITVPFSLTNLTLTSPFQFSGNLITCQDNCFNTPAVSNFSLVGGGTATFELISGLTPNGTRVFTFRTITYNFEVLEPMSILLLGGGLAALAARLRRGYRP
jgi:hypothetical protein